MSAGAHRTSIRLAAALGLALAAVAQAADPAAGAAPATNGPPVKALETPVEYFNSGAAEFVRTQDEQAKKTVAQGLTAFPNDEALKKLKELMEQQQQQQQQQQDQQDQQKQEQQKQEQQKQQQNQQNQEQKDEQKQKQEQTQEQKDQQKQEQQDKPKSAEEMTPEEAKMMLDAFNEKEEAIRAQMQKRQGKLIPVEKDW